MLVSKAISRIRSLINDTKSSRWDDTKIIDVINEGQRLIFSEIGYRISTDTIDIVAGQAEYTLPDDMYSLIRATVNGAKIEFKSYDYMDMKSDTWENDKAPYIKYLIVNKSERTTVRVYPIPSEVTVTGEYTDTTIDGGPEGAIVLYLDESDEPITPVSGTIDIRYYRVPIDVAETPEVDATLDIEDIYAETLIFYVASAILIESESQSDINRRGQYIQFYQANLNKFKKSKASAHTARGRYETSYRQGF